MLLVVIALLSSLFVMIDLAQIHHHSHQSAEYLNASKLGFKRESACLCAGVDVCACVGAMHLVLQVVILTCTLLRVYFQLCTNDTRSFVFSNRFYSSAARAKPVVGQSRFFLLSQVIKIARQTPLLTKPCHTVCALHTLSSIVAFSTSSLIFFKNLY